VKTVAPAHVYADNPDAPGTCLHCGRTDPGRTNRAHKLPNLAAETAEHRRRAGESETEQ
jgi:hypothetical protein